MDFLNGRGQQRVALEVAVSRGELVTTSSTRFEVVCGVRSAAQSAAVQAFFQLLEVLPFDERAADAAGEIDQYLRARGVRLATADTLIAGIALSRGYPLLTRNRKHFDRIPGLLIEEL